MTHLSSWYVTMNNSSCKGEKMELNGVRVALCENGGLGSTAVIFPLDGSHGNKGSEAPGHWRVLILGWVFFEEPYWREQTKYQFVGDLEPSKKGKQWTTTDFDFRATKSSSLCHFWSHFLLGPIDVVTHWMEWLMRVPWISLERLLLKSLRLEMSAYTPMNKAYDFRRICDSDPLCSHNPAYGL